MHNESFEKYQYDSCISRGICSINPRISALQTVMVLYLRLFAKYALELEIDKATRDFILNTLAITLYNPEFNETSFIHAVNIFRKELPMVMDKFTENNSDKDMKKEQEKALELFKETSNVLSAIQYGEKIFNRAVEKIPTQIRDLYNIILVIVKSISINLLDLESYNEEFNDGFNTILSLISQINIEEKDIEILKTKIKEAAQIDVKLMQFIRNTQEKLYGKQKTGDVSFSTIPNKAALVVGSNIKELETILEGLKDEDIDVYTHDDMMLAHTFPKFSEYKRLKGQYGQGLENCLLDFATFPGPIILTAHSLHNIENFYRGRLFTTDYITAPKGIIKIENYDFSEVIKSAEEAKGFKTGRQCETISIGFDYEDIISTINENLTNYTYERIFFIGQYNYSFEQQAYFENLVKLIPENILIISFSYNIEKRNLIHINTCYDYQSWIKIFDYVRNYNLPITVFVPKCERSTISQIVYMANFNKVKIYVGKCTPIILNPSLINTLQETFLIHSISHSRKDLEEILEDK